MSAAQPSHSPGLWVQVRAPFDRAADLLSGRSNRFWLVALALLGAGIYLPWLGTYPLWDPWEPHYAQVAWEMQERGTWMNPWYRGIDNWWSKPILMLWLLRASLGAFWDPAADFAANHLAARLPFALAAIGGALLQYDWVRRVFGRPTGILAAIILLTAPQYLLIGRQVMVDTLFVATYGASMGYLAVQLFTPRADGWRGRLPAYLFWGLQGLSVLAKGFVPPVLAVLVLAGYAVATFRWRDYSGLALGRHWPRYLTRRMLYAAVIAGAGAGCVLAIRTGSPEQSALYRALILGATGLLIFLGVFHDLPLPRHALHLLRRMHAGPGLVIFFAVSAPWYVYMSFAHGWPFWNEFIFYHHLGRAAGTIDKPDNTFDYYIRQLGVGLFPWSAFVVGSSWLFVARANPFVSIAGRRNFYVLLGVVLPYLFFTLSGTKFAHYIFPVVPLLATLIAATLVWLGKSPQEPELAEAVPDLGPPVPALDPDATPLWQRPGARGALIVFATLALVSFGVLARDLVADFRLFLRLFIYYYNRQTPFDYQPYIVLQLFFLPIGVLLGLLIFARWLGRFLVGGIAVGAVALACYIGWVMMPAMGETFSYESFYYAYERLKKPGEPIGQYNDWQQPERSVIFLLQNRAVHLRNNKQASAFLQRPGRKFVLVDKNRLADLRKVAKELDVPLYVVYDAHPYGRLLSNVPSSEDARAAAGHILKTLPEGVTPIDASFGNQIRLRGWEIEPPQARPGESVKVTFYYECLEVMSRDWQIFVHGDGPRGGAERIHVDHFPVDGNYPTTEWQVGEIIRDRFEVNIPANYSFDYVVLWNGWYSGDQRLELKNNPPNDGQDRVRGPRIDIRRD